jgi:amino acid adenylation domain-containing protein
MAKDPGAKEQSRPMQEPVTAGYPLSPQQKQLWSWHEEGHVPTAQIAVLLEGTLNVQRLNEALQTIVERHEILRTTFRRNRGMKFPFQLVNASLDISWEEVDLRSLHGLTEEDQIEELFAANARIDVTQTPILHACLARRGNDRHFLVITIPTMCADGASLKNLVLELHNYYEGLKSIDQPVQYADYSEWLNDILLKKDRDAQAGREYWSRHEYSSIPKLALPFERKPQANVPFRPESVAVTLDGQSLHRLGTIGSPDASNLLLSCWLVLLWRLSGQQKIVIGYTSDRRDGDELAATIGLFARTLPLHADFEQDRPFTDLLKDLAQVQAEISERLSYCPRQSLGHEQPVVFSVEEVFEKRTGGGLSFSVYRRQCWAHRFRLHLRCTHNGSSWSTELLYDPVCFSREVVEQIGRRLSILLASAAADSDSLLSALPVMDDGERRQIVTGFNQTATDYPRKKCIHELFEEQAARTPPRPALRFGEQEFSYFELNERANQLAHFLRNRGVRANVSVGLCVERSAEMIIGLLGILKAGGCYAPLIPDNPKTRLSHQMSETGAPIVVTQEKLLEHLPDFCGESVCLDRDQALLNKEPTHNPERITVADDLVYVIYTSGSTGVPKGVAVRHFNLVNYSHFICARLELDTHTQGLHFATVSTIGADLGNTSIFPSLISGGCLHVMGFETAMNPNLFASYSAQHPIDVLKITPSHLSTLLSSPDAKEILPRKFLVLGGEALSWHLVNRVLQASDCSVINHYGPTEATVGCCTYAVRENDVSAWSPATVPIGQPIANDEIYILDQHRQPVPIGVAGELCIGGTGLAKGYLNQPQQTAERFVRHPCSKDPTARVYRTGDLARFLPDGNVEFLGRLDHQVKIRGFRVEPAEIEAVLRQHELVKQSVIVPYEDRSGEKRLAAYVVLAKKQAKVEDLRAFLIEKLPEYMIPSAFVTQKSLPLTSNGKIDVRALPAPEETQFTGARDFVTPRNPEEEKLVGIWTQVLRLDRIGVNDNFFELGGHSLIATQIISRIRNIFRVQMPLHSFLETPTIAGLAEKISQCPVVETEEEEMARLMQELEGVTDEDAERLLAAEIKKTTESGDGKRQN